LETVIDAMRRGSQRMAGGGDEAPRAIGEPIDGYCLFLTPYGPGGRPVQGKLERASRRSRVTRNYHPACQMRVVTGGEGDM
jgi:hypothetical protein